MHHLENLGPTETKITMGLLNASIGVAAPCPSN